MKALIQSYPPLGQVTITKNNHVCFTCVLEVSNSRDQDEWQLGLWISVDDGDWCDMSLVRVDRAVEPQTLSSQAKSSSLLYFSASYFLQKSARFTLKFRQKNDRPWKWVRDEDGSTDGIIIISPSHVPLSDKSTPCIPDLNTEWTVTSHVSQSPGTQLWSLGCSLPGAAGQESSFRDARIGTPWGSCIRWFALVRHKAAWLGPRQGKSRFSTDHDAILCCFLNQQGNTMALLAISGIDEVTSTLRDDSQGAVVVHARNDSESPGTVTVLVSEGLDFDHAVASVMYHARNMVSNPYAVPQSGNQSGTTAWVSVSSSRDATCGFCVDLQIGTWNALGPRLSEEKVLDAVKELARNKIHITNLILDDNWQSLDRIESEQSQYGWAQFEADHQAFPNGLKNLVTRIRKLHPDIQNVLVWHALLGYWGGISPKGLLAKTYGTVKVTQEDDGTKNTLTVVGKADVSRLYDDFYKFLSESGIDGVKADAQVMVDLLTAAPDRRELMSTYLYAWSTASQRYFGAKTISCMSQFPHALFSSQLPRGGREILVRNSDDFFPDIPRSHPWHVWANAHNAILTQFLNAVPDWDMFQTSHDYSGFHGAARCVSGGPIYITDVPGEHDMKIIKQITATTPLGQTIILRPSVLGKSISAYAGYEDDSLLKIGSYNGASQTGTGILGVFNVSERRISELVPLELFPGVLEGATYIIRAHTTGKTSLPMCRAASKSLITLSLDETGYEILCAYPVTPYQSDRYDSGHVGVIGLVDKMTGCAAVAANTVIQRANGRVVVTCNIRALGTLGLYISTLAQLNIADDFMVAVEDQPVPFEIVRRSEDNDKVFEIDVGKVWEQIGTGTAQRSEVQVKVSFQA